MQNGHYLFLYDKNSPNAFDDINVIQDFATRRYDDAPLNTEYLYSVQLYVYEPHRWLQPSDTYSMYRNAADERAPTPEYGSESELPSEVEFGYDDAGTDEDNTMHLHQNEITDEIQKLAFQQPPIPVTKTQMGELMKEIGFKRTIDRIIDENVRDYYYDTGYYDRIEDDENEEPIQTTGNKQPWNREPVPKPETSHDNRSLTWRGRGRKVLYTPQDIADLMDDDL